MQNELELKEELKNYIKSLKSNDNYNIIYIDGSYNKKTDNLELHFKEKIKKL